MPPLTGIGLTLQPAAGALRVTAMDPEGPAAKGGLIIPGDLLYEVDDTSIVGLNGEQVRTLILGPPGTPLTLGLRRRNGRLFYVRVQRAQPRPGQQPQPQPQQARQDASRPLGAQAAAGAHAVHRMPATMPHGNDGRVDVGHSRDRACALGSAREKGGGMCGVDVMRVTISSASKVSFGENGFCFPVFRTQDLTTVKIFCVVGVPFVVSTASLFPEFKGAAQPKLVWILEYCVLSPEFERSCQHAYHVPSDSLRGTFRQPGNFAIETLVKLTTGPDMVSGKDCFKIAINFAVKPPLQFNNNSPNVPSCFIPGTPMRIEPVVSTVLPYPKFSIRECTTEMDNPNFDANYNPRKGGGGAVALLDPTWLQFDACTGAFVLYVPAHVKFLNRSQGGGGALQVHRFTIRSENMLGYEECVMRIELQSYPQALYAQEPSVPSLAATLPAGTSPTMRQKEVRTLPAAAAASHSAGAGNSVAPTPATPAVYCAVNPAVTPSTQHAPAPTTSHAPAVPAPQGRMCPTSATSTSAGGAHASGMPGVRMCPTSDSAGASSLVAWRREEARGMREEAGAMPVLEVQALAAPAGPADAQRDRTVHQGQSGGGPGSVPQLRMAPAPVPVLAKAALVADDDVLHCVNAVAVPLDC
eukprot:Tamp_10072.p1 GENE.Tamp_10072~~Tamp_10072.p1  ORF type:complete len:640 (-),score=80.56 Tamp_10072:4-1923(-)